MKELELIEKHVLPFPAPSYDPYDVWNTSIGQRVKKVFYKNKIAGLLPAATLTFFDTYINNSTRIGYRARHYPMVHAFRVLILVEEYKKTLDAKYLTKAKESLKWLSENYSKGYSGYCWGANMKWVSKNAVYDENTPYVTNTPYVLEAFFNYKQATSSNEYDDLLQSAFNFLEKDLSKIIDEKDVLALSYSPTREKRIVINANSYAMFCYSLFYNQIDGLQSEIEDKIKRIYRFILNTQQADGSWYYYADDKAGNFIDCFHTCFVLKNIYKANQVVRLENSEAIITKGYDYLKNNFWDNKRKLFKRFSITDNKSLVKFDLYDNAEALYLANLLNDQNMTSVLLRSIQENFIAGSDVYSNIVFPDIKINKNTLRWATMPYLYALAITKNTSI